MEVKLEADETLNRHVKPTGEGAHITVPKAWRGREVTVCLLPKKP